MGGAGHAVVVDQSELHPFKHTLSGNTERTLMKWVVDEQMLRAHPCGPGPARRRGERSARGPLRRGGGWLGACLS